MGRYSCGEDFDFWSHLVDHKAHCEAVRPVRKSSFITVASESSCELEQPPCKRIKRDSACAVL